MNFQETNTFKFSQRSTDSIAHKICNFISRNKGSLFLGLSVLATLAFSPQVLAWHLSCKVMAYSLLTFSTLQIFSVIFGRNEFMTARTGEQVNALLGVVNLCVLYLFPAISLATAVCNSSIGAASLFMRSITD